MKKTVEVLNIVTERKFGPCPFYVQTEMDAWISEMESKAESGVGWGWNARVIPKEEMEDKLLPILTEEFSEADPETGEVKTFCRLGKEYTVNITDCSDEFDLECAEKEEDEVTLKQIKQAVSIIDGWTQLSDVDINFLKKFFKYLIKKSI